MKFEGTRTRAEVKAEAATVSSTRSIEPAGSRVAAQRRRTWTRSWCAQKPPKRFAWAKPPAVKSATCKRCAPKQTTPGGVLFRPRSAAPWHFPLISRYRPARGVSFRKPPMSQKQTLSFQAEVAQLLYLVTHSLYSNKEIFLRELISNASDACDKLRFEALNNTGLYEDAPNLEVRVGFDKAARTLTITDNGIGLSQQEAIDNLGTIAKSGTREFMNRLSGDQKADAQLIGQFGVGFYSGFIVADKITVESRRAGLQGRGGRALDQRRRRRLRGGDHQPARARHQRHAASARRRRGLPLDLEAQVHHQQVLRPHLPAHPDAQGRMEGRRRGQGRRDGAHRRVGNRQPGQRACGAARRRTSRRSSTRSSTSRSATTTRRRWPGRTTGWKARPNTSSCCTSRRTRRSTCGIARRPRA